MLRWREPGRLDNADSGYTKVQSGGSHLDSLYIYQIHIMIVHEVES